MEQNYYTTEPQPRKTKNGKFGTALALVAAVAIVGGSAGFGGAYLAADMIKSNGTAIVSEADKGSSDSKAPDKGKEKPNVSDSVSSALNAANTTPSSPAANITPTGSNGAYTADELYAAVDDTIVFIKIYQEKKSSGYDDFYSNYFGIGGGNRGDKDNNEPVLAGSGSGIIFTEDGYVLTNAHMADGAARMEVIVNDYNDPEVTHSYDAEILGSDTSTDIAVLKITRDEPFKAAKLGSSASLKIGQEVCAIGNPGISGYAVFNHTMTKGIISGLNRMSLGDDGYSLDLIQTDAAINFGNSGGGLFDMYGNVVGVVNSKIVVDAYEGIGFAIPIDDAKPIVEDLVSYGYVKSRPVIGITTVELNEYRAELYGAKLTSGLLVASINEDAPVAKSDLRVSDIIIKVNGQSVEKLSQVQSIISKFKVGDTVTLTVARANDLGSVKEIDVDVILTEKSEG